MLARERREPEDEEPEDDEPEDDEPEDDEPEEQVVLVLVAAPLRLLRSLDYQTVVGG